VRGESIVTGAASIACHAMLGQIADKWSVLILASICHGPLRFNAIRRALNGVTQTALTQALLRLEWNSIVSRRVTVAVPIAVEYAITPLGRTLEPLFQLLDDWTREHVLDVERARCQFDQAAADA
jgi:DNA-binding HxlR family transcriptional regulator